MSLFKVVYPETEWATYLTDEDMGCALVDFKKWWEKAKKSLPQMEERVSVALMVVTKPQHIGILVNIMADAYREVIE